MTIIYNFFDFRSITRSTYWVIIFCLISGIALGQEENLKNQVEKHAFSVKPTPESNVNFGGAIWLRGVSIPYLEESPANARGFYIDQFRISVDGDYGVTDSTNLVFSSQVRFFTYQTLLHHMWVGVQRSNGHSLKVGVTQVPFGTLPGSTNSFWYSLGYYIGLEDDRDAGVKYHFKRKGWDVHLAYFANAEYNSTTQLNRFAPDLVRSDEQQNEELNQFNIRLARTFAHGEGSSTEIGLSGEIGQVRNRTTNRNGERWKAAAHYVGRYGHWEPKLQFSRYAYDPENPAEVDNRLVQMGFFESSRLVAAKANVLNASLKRDVAVDWWLFEELDVYLDYSRVFKDEASFADSELINPGAVLKAGPFYVWLDFMWGRNAWFFNDSANNSGPGAGAVNPDRFEYRTNLSLEWFF